MAKLQRRWRLKTAKWQRWWQINHAMDLETEAKPKGKSKESKLNTTKLQRRNKLNTAEFEQR